MLCRISLSSQNKFNMGFYIDLKGGGGNVFLAREGAPENSKMLDGSLDGWLTGSKTNSHIEKTF